MQGCDSLEAAIEGGLAAFIAFFNAGFKIECIKYMNEQYVVPFMSKLPSEKLPTNERNLTDARTRIGQLLELWFALTLQNILEKHDIRKYRASCVLANQYPDLVIRNALSEPVLRIEMKALELRSEEKSANFDALIRDIHPQMDMLCILLWEWLDFDFQGALVEVPEVREAFVFEAYPIAQVRDLGWLLQRRQNQAKAIDVSGPVIGNTERLKKEEHNLGKLTRIAMDDKNLDKLPPEIVRNSTVDAYRDFVNFTVSAGLAYNATRLLRGIGVDTIENKNFVHSPESISTISQGVIKDREIYVIVGAVERPSTKRLKAYVSDFWLSGITTAWVILFTGKFSWYIYFYANGEAELVAKGKKFDRACIAILNYLSS